MCILSSQEGQIFFTVSSHKIFLADQ